MKELTVVIAEHNEGSQLRDTLQSLYDTSYRDLYNVVVVSDGSEVDPQIIGDAEHVRTSSRGGVGHAFDTGSLYVDTPYMIIMGSDIRFTQNGYLEKMLAYLKANPKSIICTANVGINAEQMDMSMGYRRYGATILPFMKAEDLPPKGSTMSQFKDDKAVSNYRNILECKWVGKQADGIYELPAVLGAFYGVETEWYKRIDGFRGHRYWGTLEPFISLKSWFAGGSCKIASDIETAHIFKSRPSHITRGRDLIYNKLAVSRIIFDGEIAEKFVNFLGTNSDVADARNMTEANKDQILTCRKRFEKVQERDIFWFKERFPFKDYGAL